MHGFLGCIEDDDSGAQAMRRWMESWIGAGCPKRRFQVREGAFSFVGSSEPSAEADPVAHGGEGLVLGFSGFIARDQLAESGRAAPRDDAEVAAELLRRYRQGGAEALVALNGRYVAWVWDPKAGRLELMNDLLGLKPVFLWHGGKRFAFASNVWAIACHPRFRRGIDRRGMADLLLISHQQGSRTLFEEVSVLAPGSVTTWQGGRLWSRTVRTLEFSRERWDWSIERIADAMYSLLEQSVRRRVAEGRRVRLPLSGGFDSRVLLDLLTRQRAVVEAITQIQYGAYAQDARYARRLARIAGVGHRVVPLADEVFARYRQECVAVNGGMYDVHTGRFLSLMDLSGAEVIPTVSGHLGGELTGRFQISDARYATAEEHFALAFREVNMFRFPPDRLRFLVDGRAEASLVAESVEECRRFFLSHSGSPFQRLFHWDLLLSRRRYIAYQLVYYEQYAPVAAPFYDREFVDFMCSVPFAAVEGQRAYKEMLRRHMPALARVPNTNTDLPVLLSTRAVVGDLLRTQYRRFVQSPLRRVVRLRRWVGHPGSQYGYALQGASRPVLEHILRSLDRLGPFLDPDRVREAVERQLAGDHSFSMGLLALSTFATALEMLDDPHAAIRAVSRRPAAQEVFAQ